MSDSKRPVVTEEQKAYGEARAGGGPRAVRVSTAVFLAKLDEELAKRWAAADPEIRKRAEEATNPAKSEYWRTKALRLNTARGVRSAEQAAMEAALPLTVPKDEENGSKRTT